MQVKAKVDENGGLRLLASTYSSAEFEHLHNVLSRLGTIRIRNPARRDRDGREMREYSVLPENVARLERELGGRFEEDGTFSEVPTKRGHPYACREISPNGRGHGCEEIIATDQSVALMKCALIAGQNNWFGGVPQEGTCQRGRRR
jgi:hypothetical protein